AGSEVVQVAARHRDVAAARPQPNTVDAAASDLAIGDGQIAGVIDLDDRLDGSRSLAGFEACRWADPTAVLKCQPFDLHMRNRFFRRSLDDKKLLAKRSDDFCGFDDFAGAGDVNE